MIVRRRPAKTLPYLLAFVLGLTAAGLAACGSRTNPAMLPADNAAELKADLDDVLAAIESKDCGDASRAVAQVRSDLESLPSGTSQRLQDRLREGADALEQQAAEECRATETTTSTTTTETTKTETLPTVTTTPPPVETTTVPPPVETTPPAETVPTPPPVATVPPEATGGEPAP